MSPKPEAGDALQALAARYQSLLERYGGVHIPPSLGLLLEQDVCEMYGWGRSTLAGRRHKGLPTPPFYSLSGKVNVYRIEDVVTFQNLFDVVVEEGGV